jgi:hypothetical protein
MLANPNSHSYAEHVICILFFVAWFVPLLITIGVRLIG